ncbi:MAG: Ig-like domain-containing protein, partial [Fervidobacterium sp.]
ILAIDDVNVDKVEFYIENEKIGECLKWPYEISISNKDFLNLRNGKNKILLKAFDNSGNYTERSITVFIDTIPPSITLIEPKQNSIVSGITSLRYILNDNFGIENVQIYIDNNKIIDTSSAIEEYTLDTTNFSDGLHHIVINVTDIAGNSSKYDFPVFFNNTIPEIEVLNVYNEKYDDKNSGKSFVQIFINDKAKEWSIDLFVDDIKVYSGKTNNSENNIKFDAKNLSDGIHELKAVLKNNFGKIAEKSINFLVDNTSPFLEVSFLNSPKLLRDYESKSKIEILNPSEELSGEINLIINVRDENGLNRFELYVDGKNLVSNDLKGILEFDMVYTLDTEYFENGYHKLESVAIDLSGNITKKTFDLNIKNYINLKPVIKITNPMVNQEVSEILIIEAMVEDEVGIEKTEFLIDGVKISDFHYPPYQLSIDTRRLSNGTHNLTVRALNKLGNYATENLNFVVNNKYISSLLNGFVFVGYNDDVANDILLDNDGNHIIVGWTESFGSGGKDALIIKLDSQGNTLWKKAYGGIKDDVANYICNSKDGGYILVGWTESYFNSKDVYILKIDKDGNLIWDKRLGGTAPDEGKKIIPAIDEGFIIVGNTYSFNVKQKSGYVLKINEEGNLEWQVVTSLNNWEEINCVEKTNDGYILVGSTYIEKEKRDILIVKLDQFGNILWKKLIGGKEDKQGNCIRKSLSGDFLITGTVLNGSYKSDLYVARIDNYGNLKWQATLGGTGWDTGRSLVEDNDGNFVICGFTESFGNGGKDVYVLKISHDGNLIWQRTFGGIGDEVCNSIKKDSVLNFESLEGFHIVGWTNTFSNNKEVYIIKINKDGKIMESKKTQ